MLTVRMILPLAQQAHESLTVMQTALCRFVKVA